MSFLKEFSKIYYTKESVTLVTVHLTYYFSLLGNMIVNGIYYFGSYAMEK